MSTTSNPFVRAAAVLKQAKADIASILTDPDLGAVKHSVDASLDSQLNRLNHLSGSAIESTDPVLSYPPITNFMGDDITPEKPIAVSDLHVSKGEKGAFIERVDALYAGIAQLSPDAVLLGHTIPEDQLVLRGVAKKAGITNYKDAELNVQFVADLKAAIADKNVRDAEEAKTEADLVQREKVTKLNNQWQILSEKEKSQAEVYGDATRAVDAANTDAKRAAAQTRLDKATIKLEELRAERIAIENELKAADPLNAIPD